MNTISKTLLHYHFIGIGGIGMSSLARILNSRGIKVSGSDANRTDLTKELEKEGCLIYIGHSAQHIQSSMHVVYSTGIQSDNIEFQAAKEFQCPMLHRSDLLAEIASQYQSFAITGTHGKTTTSALLSTVLYEGGTDPSFSVGGVLPQFQSNSRAGKGDLFVFEADESDATFLKYSPSGAIITNIDNDHLGSFDNSEERLVEAFGSFMDQVKKGSTLFWCGDDLFLKSLNRPGQSYGFSSDCHWRITSFRQEGFRVFFDIQHGKQDYKEIELSLTGEHNALNATAVFGLSMQLGVKEEAIRKAFIHFQGVGRRCQHKGHFQGIDFIDDYAHHPTEIEATLKAIRQATPHRRLIAIFQPHRYTRTLDCLGQYGPVFKNTDQLIITDIYSAGEPPLQVSSKDIIQEVQMRSSTSCAYIPKKDLSHHLIPYLLSGDVVVTLGAGDITQLAEELLEKLSHKSTD
jgi:UDP-N-acetylmuramate--alanine ligase